MIWLNVIWSIGTRIFHRWANFGHKNRSMSNYQSANALSDSFTLFNVQCVWEKKLCPFAKCNLIIHCHVLWDLKTAPNRQFTRLLRSFFFLWFAHWMKWNGHWPIILNVMTHKLSAFNGHKFIPIYNVGTRAHNEWRLIRLLCYYMIRDREWIGP